MRQAGLSPSPAFCKLTSQTMACAAFLCVTYAAFQSGTQLGMIYAYFMFPGGTGDPPRGSNWMTCYPLFYKGMIMLPISAEHCLHIHHWMCYLPLCASCAALAHAFEEEDRLSHGAHTFPTLALIVVVGFTMVMTLHGLLMYKDRFHIKVPNPYLRPGNSLQDLKASEQQRIS